MLQRAIMLAALSNLTHHLLLILSKSKCILIDKI